MNRVESDEAAALAMLAGAPVALHLPSDADRVLRELGAKARWAFSEATKNFLSAMWKARGALCGTFKPSPHGLLFSPPIPPSRASGVAPAARALTVPADKTAWSRWLESDRPRAQGGSRSKPSNYYVVWRGRKPGVFYKWCDAHASVAGVPDAEFKGFDSLADAYAAWHVGWADHPETVG